MSSGVMTERRRPYGIKSSPEIANAPKVPRHLLVAQWLDFATVRIRRTCSSLCLSQNAHDLIHVGKFRLRFRRRRRLHGGFHLVSLLLKAPRIRRVPRVVRLKTQVSRPHPWILRSPLRPKNRLRLSAPRHKTLHLLLHLTVVPHVLRCSVRVVLKRGLHLLEHEPRIIERTHASLQGRTGDKADGRLGAPKVSAIFFCWSAVCAQKDAKPAAKPMPPPKPLNRRRPFGPLNRCAAVCR